MVPIPDNTKLFINQDIDVLFAMCIWGEARGGPLNEKFGVANVIQNRFNKGWLGDHSRSSVILRKDQFDCFMPNDPNYTKLIKPLLYDMPSVWSECYYAALGVLIGRPDNTNGAIFYYSKPIVKPPTAWGEVEFTVQYGDTYFFKPTDPNRRG